MLAEQGQPHGAPAVVVHDAPPHGAHLPRRPHPEGRAGRHRRGEGACDAVILYYTILGTSHADCIQKAVLAVIAEVTGVIYET